MKINGLLGMGLILGLTGIISGCGGGGGGSTAASGPSGRLVQGPVTGATIFADNVSGGVRFTQDSGEVFTTTNAVTGDFTLPSVPSYNYVLVSKGGTDKLTGQPAMQMIAPAGSANVTPLTTLVALDTTGTVKAKLEAMMPTGSTFDADISTTANPAILMVAKSVESMVAGMTNAVSQKATAGGSNISDAQISSIQAGIMLAITQELANPVVDATTLVTTANLSTTLQAAATSAVISINSAGNITIPTATATTIATSCVSATATALSVGATASTTTIVGGESTVMTATVADTLSNAIASASTVATTSIIATTTPTAYTPPPIQVVTPPTITPAAGSQTIGIISFNPATLSYNGTTTASASATPSGLAVTFTSITPNVCTVTGSTIKAVAPGMCIIAADQSGGTVNSTVYSAATQMRTSIAVSKASQAITVTKTSPTGAANGSTFTVAATASSSLPVTYSSGSASVCTNSGTTFTMIADSGTCIVNFDQAGDTSYNPALRVTNNTSASAAVIPPKNQTIGNIGFNPATLNVGSTTTASASATSGLGVTFASTTPNVCTVTGSIVTGKAAGTCTIAANQGGDVNYNAAPQVTKDIAVVKLAQTIGPVTFGTQGGSTISVSASATSGLAVIFTSSTPTICSVSGTTVTGLIAGTCTIAANQSGNDIYNAANSVFGNITVNINTTGATGGSTGGTGVGF
jgi:hypothetical protein